MDGDIPADVAREEICSSPEVCDGENELTNHREELKDETEDNQTYR